MSNPFDEISHAIAQAQEARRAVAKQSNSMARLLRGNLHEVEGYILVELKRELQRFDATRKKWKK